MSRRPCMPMASLFQLAMLMLIGLPPHVFVAAVQPSRKVPAALPPLISCTSAPHMHTLMLPLILGGAGSPSSPNRLPTTVPCALVLAEDMPGALNLQTVARDADGDTLTWALGSAAYGSVSLHDSTLVYTPTANYNGPDTVAYTVSDGRGGTAQGTVAMTVTPVNDPPVVTLNAEPLDGTAPLAVDFSATAIDVEGTGLTYAWAFGDGATAGNSASTSNTYTAPGSYTATLVVSDGATTTQIEKTITVRSAGDQPLEVMLSAMPISGTHPLTVTLNTTVTNAQGALTYSWDFGDGTVAGNLAQVTHIFTRTGLFTARVTVSDTRTTETASIDIRARPRPGELADPADLAPPIDSTVETSLISATEFIYNGPDPVQTGVAPGTIEALRVAVLRGRVMTRDGAALSRVTISVLDHPEFGQTRTRADGMFDLVVNGGGQLTVNYAKAGYLPSQRQLETPWQDFIWAPDVALVAVDPRVTTVSLQNSTTMQTARGTVVDDGDGARQATLLFPQGVTATMVVDGQEQPLTTLHVRATEYTVGDNGPEAMPGELPPQSGYTYAAEFSIDEALAAGATDVRFSQPVPFYLENFLDFPVGGIVPAGYYDRAKGMWVAAPNGRVVKIVGISGGLATLDTNGDGAADDVTTLAALGVTTAERERLADLYQPGETLWRVPISHFTPWDCNWPYGPPPDAKPPRLPDPRGPNRPKNPKGSDDDCNKKGSIIGCQAQTLGEEADLIGTPFWLHYKSDRIPRPGDYTLQISLSDATLPPNLKRIDVEFQVAGRRITHSVAPTSNQSYTFVWDGKDVYGRTLMGIQGVTGRTGYVYEGLYQEPTTFAQSFGDFSGVPISGDRTRQEITLWQDWRAEVGGIDARSAGLGGWTLNVHHIYYPSAQFLYQGDGSQRSTGAIGSIITRVAGAGNAETGGDGGPALLATFEPWDVAVAPDGSYYIADANSHRIRKVGVDGIITTVAGTGMRGTANGGFSGDGGPATAAKLNLPVGVGLGPDGSLYIADGSNNRIRKVGPDGIISTVAGIGTNGFSGDGGPAKDAQIGYPSDVEVGPDGSLYIADPNNQRIRRVGPDGIITTVAGSGPVGYGSGGFSGDGGPATSAQFAAPLDVAIGSDGTIFIADHNNARVRRVGPDGIITTIAGTGTIYGEPVAGDGGQATSARIYPGSLAVGRDGSLFITDQGRSRIRRIGPDGIITSAVGSVTYGADPEGGLATAAYLHNPGAITMGPGGDMLFTGPCNCIRRVASPLPSVLITEQAVPSEDGGEVYIFSIEGRHLRTLDAISGIVRYQFGYNAAGHLSTVTDADGLATMIQHAANGNPTGIVGPYGQRTGLAVDTNGFLSTVTNPAGERVVLTSSTDGLLQSLTDPRGNLHQFAYDAAGLLIGDTSPAGTVRLARSDTPSGTCVTFTSALNRTTTYDTEYLADGAVRRVTTDPSGAKTEALLRSDGSRTVTYPDGSSATQTFGPDPRWGMLAPLTTGLVNTTAGGLISRASLQRTVSLVDSKDPFSLRVMTDQVTINDRIYTSMMTRNTVDQSWTLVRATPAGRRSSSEKDARGRVTSITPATGIDPILYTYDAQGRISEMHQGAQSLAYTYNSLNQVSMIRDALGRQVTYTYDTAGRVRGVSMPGAHTYAYAYDANGNRTGVTLPGDAQHSLAYSPLDVRTAYTPPGNPAYTRVYDADESLASITLPDGRVTTWRSDTSGRPMGPRYAEATSTFSYADSTDRVSGVTRAPATGAGQTIASTYDSFLLKQMTAGGAAQGQYSYSYDANFLLTAMNLSSGADTVMLAISRDLDGLITGYGPFTYTRSGPGGAVNQIGDGIGSLTLDYDTLARPATRASSVNGAQTYGNALTFDSMGKITRKVETIAGTAVTYDYSYDDADQLITVTRNGTAVEQYTYDANGNRTSSSLATGASEMATYDPQDRLTMRGGVAYTWNASGFLTGRGADTFEYSARGELIGATAGGQTSSYAYDGWGRRVSQTTGAETYQYLYGDPEDMFRVTAMRDPAGLLTSYLYDEQGLLYALQRGGERFYVATDQVGTPRVVSTGAGVVVKALSYDSFGNLLADSAPQWDFPIGFAGGLRDSLTGLVHFGLRDYDPASGRWTARDPVLFDSGQGNLYSYVGNSPVTDRDPLGLATFGYSQYDGYGGGGKIGIGPSGLTVCAEIGLGWGGGLETNLTEDAPATGWNEKVEVTAGFGPASIGGGVKIDNCGRLTRYGKAKVGPVGYDTADKWGVGKGSDKHVEASYGKLKSKIEAKLAAEGCVRLFSW